VRSYKGFARCGVISIMRLLFVGAHLVRDKPTERYTAAWLSRTGCAPTDKPAWQRHMLKPMRSEAPL